MKRYREILHIALPAMAENLLQFLMGLVDSYLVAFLGLVALSGVSLANNIMAVYQAVFIALKGNGRVEVNSLAESAFGNLFSGLGT